MAKYGGGLGDIDRVCSGEVGVKFTRIFQSKIYRFLYKEKVRAKLIQN